MSNFSRLNLKELRDLLNKFPEKNLDKFAISNDLFIDDPEGKIAICYRADDDEAGEVMSLYELPEYEILKTRLLRHLNDDVRKCAMFKLGTYDEELELEENEPDWECDDK